MPPPVFSDAEIVDRTLRLMRQSLAGFVHETTAKAKEDGLLDDDESARVVGEIGFGKPVTELDTRGLLRLMERVWNPVFWDKPGRLGRTYATELRIVGNARAHSQDLKTFDATRFVDTAMKLLGECGADLPDDLQALHRACRGSEPPVEPDIQMETTGETELRDLILGGTAVIEERLAYLGREVASANDVLAVLRDRGGTTADEPRPSETPLEGCTRPQAAKIFAMLRTRLKVNVGDVDAVRDALDDPKFDGSLIICGRRFRRSCGWARRRRSRPAHLHSPIFALA